MVNTLKRTKMDEIDKECSNCKWLADCDFKDVEVCPDWEEEEGFHTD